MESGHGSTRWTSRWAWWMDGWLLKWYQRFGKFTMSGSSVARKCSLSHHFHYFILTYKRKGRDKLQLPVRVSCCVVKCTRDFANGGGRQRRGATPTVVTKFNPLEIVKVLLHCSSHTQHLCRSNALPLQCTRPRGMCERFNLSW